MDRTRELYCPCRGRRVYMYGVRKQTKEERLVLTRVPRGTPIGSGMETEMKTGESLQWIWVDPTDNTADKKKNRNTEGEGRKRRSHLLGSPHPSGICQAHRI